MIEETLCPECNGPMVSRKNKTTGQVFWGCKNFPKCKGTRDTDGMSKEDRRRDRDYFDDSEDDIWHPGHPSHYGDN